MAVIPFDTTWHIFDLPQEEQDKLKDLAVGIVRSEVFEDYEEGKDYEVVDVCVVGSRAYPLEFRRFIRPTSDVDLVVKVKWADGIKVSPVMKNAVSLESKFFFKGAIVHLYVATVSHDCSYAQYGYALPYYSLVDGEYYVPSKLDIILHLQRKFHVNPQTLKCMRCGKELSANDMHIIRFNEPHTRIDLRGVVCSKCLTELMENELNFMEVLHGNKR